MTYLNGGVNAINQLLLGPGTVLEVATTTTAGTVDGTALFEVLAVAPTDADGQAAEVRFCGASVLAREIELDGLFPAGVGAPYSAVLHLCSGSRGACGFSVGPIPRNVLHIDMMRTRRRSGIVESWARQHLLNPKSPAGAWGGAAPLFGGGGGGAPDGGGDGEMTRLKKENERLKKEASKANKRPGARLFEAASSQKDRRGPKNDGGGGVSMVSVDSDDDDKDDGALFRSGPSRSGSIQVGAIQDIAADDPGALYQSGLSEMMKFVNAREGGDGEGDQPQKVLSYLTAIFHGQFPVKEVGIRTSRELKTIALALDELGKGHLPQVGDLLMQRFKALQTSVVDGNWATAKRLELLPDDQITLTSFEERRQAAKDELVHLKLEEAQERAAQKKRR